MASAAAPRDFQGLSIRELRAEITRRGLDVTGCLERADLLERLQSAPPPPPSEATSEAPLPLEQLPIAKLRRLLEKHESLDAAKGANEKRELVSLLRERLARCPVCLDDVGEEPDPTLTRACVECRTTFHRCCMAGVALSAAEQGRLPLLCPVSNCRCRWPPAFVAWALEPAELARYNAAVRSVKEMRNKSGGVQQLSPRTAASLRGLGVRGCPKCGALIEKQEAGFGHGCDKMTCRCGCLFCFHCNTVAGPGGAPRCQCVGAHHHYLSHEDVMRNYQGQQFSFNSSTFADLPGARPCGGQTTPLLPAGVRQFASSFGFGGMVDQVSGVVGQAMRANAAGTSSHASHAR